MRFRLEQGRKKMDTNIRREQRAGLIATARGIVDGADADSRALTSEEQEQIDRVFADADALQRTIEREDQLASAEAEMRSFQRRTVTEPVTERATTELAVTAQPEYRAAFNHWLRSGDRSELRALEVGVAGEGGNLVDDGLAAAIIEKADEMSFVRGLSNVITASTDTKIPVESTKMVASIIEEEGSFSAGTTDPAWTQITLGSYKLGGNVLVSEELLYDASYDVQATLARSFGRSFALGEDQYCLTGTGSGQPTGIFTEAGTGSVTADAAAAVTTDELMDLYHAVAPEYRVGTKCAWVMHDSTAKAIRQLKDTTNQYLWQPGLAAGQPDTLLGRPVYLNSNVEELATGNKTVAFCNFDYFTIVDRGSIAVQRLDELYANTGQIGFRGYKRFDARLGQDAACAVLTMG